MKENPSSLTKWNWLLKYLWSTNNKRIEMKYLHFMILCIAVGKRWYLQSCFLHIFLSFSTNTNCKCSIWSTQSVVSYPWSIFLFKHWHGQFFKAWNSKRNWAFPLQFLIFFAMGWATLIPRIVSKVWPIVKIKIIKLYIYCFCNYSGLIFRFFRTFPLCIK